MSRLTGADRNHPQRSPGGRAFKARGSKRLMASRATPRRVAPGAWIETPHRRAEYDGGDGRAFTGARVDRNQHFRETSGFAGRGLHGRVIETCIGRGTSSVSAVWSRLHGRVDLNIAGATSITRSAGRAHGAWIGGLAMVCVPAEVAPSRRVDRNMFAGRAHGARGSKSGY